LKPARTEDLAAQVAQNGKLAVGPLDRSSDWLEAAAPVLNSNGVLIGLALARVPQGGLDTEQSQLDSWRFWLTLLGALAGGAAAALARVRALKDLTSVEGQLEVYL